MLEKFVEFISFSSLKKFEDCPYQWYMRYIEKIEDEVGDAAQIGKLAHLFIKAAIAGDIRHDKDAFNDLAIDIAGGECSYLTEAENIVASELYNQYGSENYNKLLEWTLYTLSVRAEYNGEVELEKEILVKLPGIPIPFKMYIDMLGKDLIVDWKTGYNRDSLLSHQLGIYAWGAAIEKGTSPDSFIRKFAYTDLQKIYEDTKPVQSALEWALSIYNRIEDSLAGVAFAGKNAFEKNPGTSCHWCSYKERCFEEEIGPVELIVIPDEIKGEKEAQKVAQSLLLLTEKIKRAEKALEDYCNDNDCVIETNGYYFGFFPGPITREWDKVAVVEALMHYNISDMVKALNIDLKGINSLAKDNPELMAVLATAVTEKRGKPKFKFSSSPPKAV